MAPKRKVSLSIARGSIAKKVKAKANKAVDPSKRNKAMTDADACDSITPVGSDKNITGLQLFRKDYYAKHIKNSGKRHFEESHKKVVDAWRDLTKKERNAYNAKANARRAAYWKTHGLSNTKTPAFQTRCSPGRFHERIAKLNGPQLAAIKEMGFGPLLEFDCNVLNHGLCLELVKSFDLQDHSLCIKGSRISVTYDDVGLVMGIPDSGMEVKSSATEDELSDINEFGGITFTELENIMATEMYGVRFKRTFLLYALSILLCPTSKNSPSSKLLPAIIDIDRVVQYNWSKFVFDWLVKEITRYKQACISSSKPKDKKTIGGCMYFLMIIYFHKQPLGSISICNDWPLLKTWNTMSVKHRIREEKSNEQGLLYHFEESFDPTWPHHTLEHEVTRYVFKKVFELVLKPLDDSLMAGRLI